jgi:MraZ protein
MLLGEHEHALDEKNRLTLPSKLRGAFTDGVVVSRGLDGCLLAWPVEAWRAMVARGETVDPFSADGR